MTFTFGNCGKIKADITIYTIKSDNCLDIYHSYKKYCHLVKYVVTVKIY